jgi:hypothetical protein
MIVLYVDDLGIAYSNKRDLDKLFQDLTELGLEFTCEGTFTDFLGIKFVKDEVTNTVTLTQKGLIQKIIKATGLQDCNPNHTSALQACLGIDPDGEPMDELWNYHSIAGMLLYLLVNKHKARHHICSKPSGQVQPFSQEELCQCNHNHCLLPAPYC